LAGPLTQVMIHLLHFAAQSFEHEGDVWVTTWREDDYVKTSIRYNGVPIPSQVLPQLFDLDRDEDHTNIGLTIALNIVEKHGGGIQVSTDRDETTVFLVNIPIVTPDGA
jgi:signal transduction histidine kinase